MNPDSSLDMSVQLRSILEEGLADAVRLDGAAGDVPNIVTEKVPVLGRFTDALALAKEK